LTSSLGNGESIEIIASVAYFASLDGIFLTR
jgi:hypothetical protein